MPLSSFQDINPSVDTVEPRYHLEEESFVQEQFVSRDDLQS